MFYKAVVEVNDVSKSFGGIMAVSNVSLTINRGELVGIIGPNGSGKTTLMNLITGFYRPDSGTIKLNGVDATKMEPYEIAKLGVGRTFQLTRLFFKASVLENVVVAASTVSKSLDKAKEKAEEMLKLVNLNELRNENAENLSFGQQRLLEFVRALIRDPEIMFLDEPTGGVNPVMISRMAELIVKLNREGKTFVIVEHNVKFVRQICKRVIVLHEGKIIADGQPEDVLSSGEVLSAYLGKVVSR